MKRLNDRYNDWQTAASARLVAALDHPTKPPAKRHIGIWDLLSGK